MDNTQDRLRHLHLTGVRPNGKDIGVGAYGRVFEVEYCGTVYAAKEIHSILVQGVRREEFEVTKKAFLTECLQSSVLGHANVVITSVTMAEGACSRFAVDNGNSSKLRNVLYICVSEISEYDSASDSSSSPRLEVEPYLFEPERSSVDSEVRGVRHLLKSCTRFRNQLDFQLISDFKLDFSDFQAPEINGDLAKMLV